MSSMLALLLALTSAVPDGAIVVRPTRGQELVYRGRFAQESLLNPTSERQRYDLEARVFVIESGSQPADVAFLTVLRAEGAAPDETGSARLELGAVDSRGRITLDLTGAGPLAPLDGPPSLEAAGFVELPQGPINIGSTWDAADGPRPPREWRVEQADFHHGARCLKLLGTQQSAEWDRPTGDGTAWRRTDVVWLAIHSGTVLRRERTIERRAGADGSAGYRATTEYELTDSFVYPDQLAADRRREVTQAGEYNRTLATVLPRAGRAGPSQQFQSLLARLDRHVAANPATPYRPAVLAARRRAEAALRGEVLPPADAPDPPTAPPTVGRPAPDFVTSDLVTGEPMRLTRWRGRPVVLLFVRPDSQAASATLRLAQELRTRHGDQLRVAVLVIADEERARPAWAEFGVPLLAGRDVAVMYGVSDASRAVVVDASGVVRYVGQIGPVVEQAISQTPNPPAPFPKRDGGENSSKTP
jgi:hypothetical protein